MATSGVMDDFARMPTSRKALVFAVTALVLGGLYFRFVYSGLREEVDEAQGSYETVERQHAAAVADLEKFAKLRPAMDDLLAELARNQAALPTEAEVPAFFETLQRKVKESGVEIVKWQKRPEESIESFVKVPVEVEITGTFTQIKRFFASLVQKNLGGSETDERERIVSIESLAISQPQVKSREIILNGKFMAVTFRQDEKGAKPTPTGAVKPLPPVAPPPGPGAGAGAGAGGGTPARVKAQVEDALKQGGEARVRDDDTEGDTGSARLRRGN